MSQGAAQDPLIGRSFRGYRIEHLIARGGMGAVYRARDESLPNVCKVIKVLLPELAENASTRAFVLERFEREALAVSVMKHDNIVGIHAVGTIDGQPCMLMDYVEGQTLDEVIRDSKGRVPPYRVMHYMCHVARGVDFAHSLGIVHRDLKPSNIIACATDNDPHFCKLLDFGMAKLTRPLSASQLVPTMGGMGLGTPCFMAVEQFRHADEASALSDVYALAIIVWLMVTGELPWGLHDTSDALGLSALYEMQRDKAPNPPPPGTLPPAWERTLRAAMSPDPDARPQSIRHFMVELAVGLEPMGPHVKGGVEILRLIAPKFIAESSHDAETVRDTPHRTIVVAWPRQETPVRAAAAGIQTRPALPRHAQPGQPTPILSPESSAGRGSAPSAIPASASTLGASNGVILAAPRTANGWKLASVVAVAAIVTTVVLLSVGGGGERSGASPELPAPPAPSSAPPSATATPSATAPPPRTAPTAAGAAPTQIAPTAPVHAGPQDGNRPVSTTASQPTPPVGTIASPHVAPASRLVKDDPTHAPPAPTTRRSPTSRATSRPSAPSKAFTQKRGDEPRVQKRKFDPNAPADGE